MNNDVYIIEKNTLTDIADAVREITGEAGTIAPTAIASKIRAAAGSGGVEVPLITVNLTVEGDYPVNISYITVVDSVLQHQQVQQTFQHTFQTIRNSLFELWTSEAPNEWNDTFYPPISTADNGYYVGGAGMDSSMAAIHALCDDESDSINITVTTSLL